MLTLILHKGVMGFLWLTEHCRNAKLIVKRIGYKTIKKKTFKFWSLVSCCVLVLFFYSRSDYKSLGSKTGKYQNDTNKIRNNSFIYGHRVVKEKLKYTVKMQPNLIQLINWTNPKYPMDAKYLRENKELCSSVNNLTVLVVVNSATDHFERRQTIRKTWTNDTYYSHLGIVRVLFLLGRSLQPSVQAGIEKEFNKYKDILQGDFIDAYLNLTHKGVMGYKWLTERCRNAKIILKSDDDILVNMFIYFRKLDELLLSTNVFCEYQPSTIFRNKSSKWYVSENHFRGEISYKKYCTGKFVSMTNDIFPSLYESAIKTPFFPYDDVLLFGYVMHNIQGLGYETLGGKDFEMDNKKAMICLIEQKDHCKKFIIGTDGGKEMEEAWFMILKYFPR